MSFESEFEDRIPEHFGKDARVEGPLAESGAGRRLHGIDLTPSLTADQVTCLLDGLANFGIISIASQGLDRFSLAHFERFANHWGAPVPHPNNFTRGGKRAQSDAPTGGKIEWLPFEKRRVAAVNAAFPGELECLPHESPTVLVVANFSGKVADSSDDSYFIDKSSLQVGKDTAAPIKVSEGGSWHTDIEYEPLPIYVSMFLVHRSPVARNENGTWVDDHDHDTAHPYLEDSDEELLRLRKRLPLNGETAFADTAAAFAALPESEQASLETMNVRRRLNEGDKGWLAPLVRVNPRSGIKSLHSPIWASRPRVRPAIEVDGMSMEDSRTLLDRLEAHCLQPRFRYDHHHVAGDVTIWSNYMSLHNSPPIKSNITSIDDARLLYRLSCKGEPAVSLPRNDPQEWLDEHIAGGYTTPGEMLKL